MALDQLNRIRSEKHLLDFIKATWSVLEPSRKFTSGWAVEAICEHLEAVSNGQITRLLINVPPGCTKSMTTNVFWPAWEWGPRKQPHLRYISASHEAGLSIRDNLRCRDLIRSEWYQQNWGHLFQFKEDQNAKIRFENTASGWRFACGVGAGLTGNRGDRIVIDDPHSAQGSDSEADRESALRWFTETIPTRLNDPDKSAIVIIMQRLHESDVSGLIISKKLGYDHLCLPMEFEPDHPTLSHTKLGFKDPRTHLGELLWPERFSAKFLEQQKLELSAKGGTYAIAGQLQQRPAPRGGGMFQRKDFNIVETKPSPARRVRGWDLAATKDGHGAFTACVKMSIDARGKLCIEDVRRIRGSPGEVERLLQQCAHEDDPSTVQSIPQDPGQAGKSQIAYFAAMLHGKNFHSSPESGSKEDRARPLAAQCESGNMSIVRAAWNDDFLNEACSFPYGEHKDQVDAASRAYATLTMRRAASVGISPMLMEG